MRRIAPVDPIPRTGPAAPRSRRARAAAALGALALAGCGEPVDIVAWDVTLTPVSDCRQTGQSTQCADPTELESTVRKGRWLVEQRPQGDFILTREDGETLPGLSFVNDGRNVLVVQAPDRPDVTVGCSGEGGVCYFTRVAQAGTDPTTDCARQSESAIIVHDVEGTLRGQIVDAFATEDDCATPTTAIAIIDVQGTKVDEPSLAREVYGE